VEQRKKKKIKILGLTANPSLISQIDGGFFILINYPYLCNELKERKIMKITIEIENCTECTHLSHTGAFTKRGSKPCCDHKDTIKEKGYDCFNRVIPYKVNYNEIRPTKEPKRIPDWCPLKNGGKY